MNIKYLKIGREVEVIQKLKKGFLVRDIYEGYEKDEYFNEDNDGYVVQSVVDKPPTLKLDSNIKYLLSEIEKLKTEKQNLTNEIEKIKIENKRRFEKYKQIEKLNRLDEFLDGKITHYVDCSYHPKIIENIPDRLNSGLKLLFLFGESNKTFEWRLNEYDDGSGYNKTVIPCTSYQEAQKVLQKYIDSKIKKTGIPTGIFVEAAKEYDLKISDSDMLLYKKDAINNLEKKIKGQNADIDINNKKIRQLKNDHLEEQNKLR